MIWNSRRLLKFIVFASACLFCVLLLSVEKQKEKLRPKDACCVSGLATDSLKNFRSKFLVKKTFPTNVIEMVKLDTENVQTKEIKMYKGSSEDNKANIKTTSQQTTQEWTNASNSSTVINISPSSAATSRVTKIPYEKFMTNLTDSSHYDQYLQVMMESDKMCQDASSYDAIMAVHTAPGYTAKRQAFRWLYRDLNKTHPYRLKVIFFIGLVNNPALQSTLMNESKTFGDIVQGNFIDSYRNMTYKAVFAFHWLNYRCRGLKFLLRLDDDVFMDVGQFFDAWRQHVNASAGGTIMCDHVARDGVFRKGKWAVDQADVAAPNYSFTKCRGYLAALTPDLVGKMDEVARRTAFFWIDDVFMFGFVANKVGARFVNFLHLAPKDLRQKFQMCLKEKGKPCSGFITITEANKFQSIYSMLHNNTNTSGTTASSNATTT